jgi:putative transposase
MINQHLSNVSYPPKVATAIAELQDFIAGCRHAREARKALAVKLVYQDYLYEEIQTILDVSLGSITGWKQAYEQNGLNGLKMSGGELIQK